MSNPTRRPRSPIPPIPEPLKPGSLPDWTGPIRTGGFQLNDDDSTERIVINPPVAQASSAPDDNSSAQFVSSSSVVAPSSSSSSAPDDNSSSAPKRGRGRPKGNYPEPENKEDVLPYCPIHRKPQKDSHNHRCRVRMENGSTCGKKLLWYCGSARAYQWWENKCNQTMPLNARAQHLLNCEYSRHIVVFEFGQSGSWGEQIQKYFEHQDECGYISVHVCDLGYIWNEQEDNRRGRNPPEPKYITEMKKTLNKIKKGTIYVIVTGHGIRDGVQQGYLSPNWEINKAILGKKMVKTIFESSERVSGIHLSWCFSSVIIEKLKDLVPIGRWISGFDKEVEIGKSGLTELAWILYKLVWEKEGVTPLPQENGDMVVWERISENEFVRKELPGNKVPEPVKKGKKKK